MIQQLDLEGELGDQKETEQQESSTEECDTDDDDEPPVSTQPVATKRAKPAQPTHRVSLSPTPTPTSPVFPKDEPDARGAGSAPPDSSGGGGAPPGGSAPEEEPPLPVEPELPVRGSRVVAQWDSMAQQCLKEVADLPSNIRGLAESAASGVLQAAQDDSRTFAGNVTVAFCVTCFRCGWQLRKAILANLLMVLPYRSACKIYVVLFKSSESDSDLEWLQQHAAPALASGLLVVAISDMPNDCWQCSLAKNTAHKFAVLDHRGSAGGSAPQFLINLDCDNILGPRFMESMGDILSDMPVQGCLHAVGKDPGTTGRCGMWATNFIRIGGYDEDTLPTGYEDVDLIRRCQWVSQRKPTYMRKDVCGASIPNHLTDKRQALGAEKVRHVDPAFAGMSYHEMNQKNVEKLKNKLKRGLWFRNFPEELPPVPFGSIPGHLFDRFMACIGRPLDKIGRITFDNPPVASGAGGSAPTETPAGGSAPTETPAGGSAPPPPPPPQEIMVMSMGVAVCQSTVSRSEASATLQRMASRRGRGGGLGPVLDKPELFAQVIKDAGHLTDTDKLVVLGARMFSDPDRRSTSDRRHVGLHDDKISEVVQHSRFKRWLLDARDAIERNRELLRPGQRLIILTYCRKGAHRSVVCAVILHHCVSQRCVGAHVLPTHHFSKRHLWRRDYCGECQDCVNSASSFKMCGAELQTRATDHSFSPQNHFLILS